MASTLNEKTTDEINKWTPQVQLKQGFEFILQEMTRTISLYAFRNN